MFEIGDKVELVGFDKPIFGRIVGYYFDEGNVWEVRTDGGNLHNCSDDDLIPAK